jgi:hypothetical protein
MAIQYTAKSEGNLLIIEASGYDENLKDVLKYVVSVYNECKKGNCSRVLCNEINLEYRIGTLDTFKLAEFLSVLVPSIVRAAIVCNEKFIADAKFWETVAINRGVAVRVFKEVEAARDWLNEK